MNKFISAAVFATTSFFAVGQAMADTTNTKTTSANFDVKIQINSTCAITATPIDFGQINSNTAAADKTGTLNVTCTKATPYSIGLKGTGAMKSTSTDNTDTIAYALYNDSNTTEQWNDTDHKYSFEGTGLNQPISVLARVTGSTNVPAGNYVDTVTATVTY